MKARSSENATRACQRTKRGGTLHQAAARCRVSFFRKLHHFEEVRASHFGRKIAIFGDILCKTFLISILTLKKSRKTWTNLIFVTVRLNKAVPSKIQALFWLRTQLPQSPARTSCRISVSRHEKWFCEEMVEGTGWNSTKNYPKTIPEHVGSGFEWSGAYKSNFRQFHDLDTATPGLCPECTGPPDPNTMVLS